MRLLIIDQNAESVSALCEALGTGHAAVVTGNWLEALSHLRTGCFEAALMNFDLSGFPGLKCVLQPSQASPRSFATIACRMAPAWNCWPGYAAGREHPSRCC